MVSAPEHDTQNNCKMSGNYITETVLKYMNREALLENSSKGGGGCEAKVCLQMVTDSDTNGDLQSLLMRDYLHLEVKLH